MKKLNITKEHFEKSDYFNKKYGKLEYVSESGKLFKTDKGKVLMFKESEGMGLSPDELDDELSAEIDSDEIKNDDFYDEGLERAMKDYGRKIARYAKVEATPQSVGCGVKEISLWYVDTEKNEIWYEIDIVRASRKDNLDYSDIDDKFIKNMYDVMFKSYGEFVGWKFPYKQYCHDGVMENGNELPIAIGIKIDMKQVKVSKRHVDDARLDYLTNYEESTKKFGKKFAKESSEGDDPEVQRLAKKVLASMKKMRKTLDDYGIPKFSKTYEMPCGDRLEITLKAGRDDSFHAIGGGSVLIFYANYGRHIGGWAMDIDADGHIQYPELYNHTHRVIEAFNIFLSEFSKDFQEYVRHYEDDEFDESSKGKIPKFVNESEEDDMEKEFTYKGISITR